ncbi:MAG: beta-hydroxyacyl-ACP dehydratase [Planctomycetaceae bacterium]|nr:beta-hydroxyacyl-ACP dehydratase [Planctomycetaceae bacterium]
MSAKDLLIDPALLDFDQVVADVEEIRRYNPQRFEMEQLTAVIYEDLEEYACAGYKDIGRDEFWVRGHMPDMPLMPGVIVLEAAAQLCSFFSQKHDLLGAAMIGFGGLENVRFRAPIIPGDRLLLICKMTKVRPGRMIVCRFQAVVGETLVVDGMLKGIPIPVDAL